MSEVLVDVKNLKKYFPTGEKGKTVKAVDDISFQIYKGETLGVVGESGCGKSTTGRLVLHLLEPTEGTVTFDGQDLSRLKKSEMRTMRKRMQIIFQDPYASLDPRKTVFQILEEPYRIHHPEMSREEIYAQVEKLIACAGQGVELSGVPTEIKILPLGRVHSQKGDFNVDDESFELIRKQFKDRKLDLVIDYEHQTLSDVQAPAGGWIKDLYKGEDAIIAKVEWTPKAAEYLKNKEYRYLSPVVLVRKRDQKATAIHSVALTNTPAIDGMFALVNSLDIEDISEGGNIMDLKELAKALGLPETATEEEIKKAVEDAVKAAEKLKEMDGKKPGEGDGKPGDGEPKPEGADMVANSTILSMLGLKADAKTEDVAASIMALKAGAPDTQAELLALKQRMAERDADEEVQKALKAGKITAAQSEWAKSYALKDMEGFKGFVDKAPAVVPQGKLDLKDAPAASNSDEVDVAILKNMGVSMEDVKKYNKKED